MLDRELIFFTILRFLLTKKFLWREINMTEFHLTSFVCPLEQWFSNIMHQDRLMTHLGSFCQYIWLKSRNLYLTSSWSSKNHTLGPAPRAYITILDTEQILTHSKPKWIIWIIWWQNKTWLKWTLRQDLTKFMISKLLLKGLYSVIVLVCDPEILKIYLHAFQAYS